MIQTIGMSLLSIGAIGYIYWMYSHIENSIPGYLKISLIILSIGGLILLIKTIKDMYDLECAAV
ncbi:hypothetical protein LCGC14_2077020 [marine sediment metagenome]|uniref:Uncharacterized protein n=1 Tax=marine sediment metagenome TaxID=412755 RepID=A0A0F9EGK5_9ZZZZ